MNLLDHWKPPPHYDPPWPVAWFFALALPVRIALLFAYWLYMGAAGVMAGLGVAGSLIGSFIALGLMVGCYLTMVAARRLEWLDEPRELAWRILAVALGGVAALIGCVVIVLPAIVVLVLAFWALSSVPLWLYRR